MRRRKTSLEILALLALLLGLTVIYAQTKRFRRESARDPGPPISSNDGYASARISCLAQYLQISDLALLQNGEVWATGYDGHEPKNVGHSRDGGQTWSTEQVPTEESTTQAVSFVDSQQGWMVGSSGTVVATGDGGKTWKKLARPTHYPLGRVAFVNSKVGYASAGTELGCQIFRSTDGGNSWTKIYEATEGGDVFDIAALNEDVALFSINDDHLIETEDGGRLMRRVNRPDGAAGLAFTSEGVAWLVGRKGSFYYSLDHGRSWARPAPMPHGFLTRDWNSITFSDSKNGIAVGNSGAVAITSDNGRVWLELDAVDDNFGRVRATKDYGLIIGNGNVYKVAFGAGAPAIENVAKASDG